MAALVNVIIIVAVLVLVAGRQLQARKVDLGRRFWVLPVVLAVIALRDPKVIDHAHEGTAIALLAGSVVLVLVMGVVWGWTVRIWRAADGSVWAKGTAATIAAWSGLIAVRVGLYATGAVLHVHQSSSALLLTLGVLLLTRSLVVNWRARLLEGPQPLRPVA
ncbi:DUF1453 domain-containing protein [Kitasatospora sp. NPDC006697]|uniref:DUF1453 domain-containing protein n=1 Tax=Kitasatospora sp. NPDC006697 TaxID=3364020 RepID=UPI0036B19C03